MCVEFDYLCQYLCECSTLLLPSISDSFLLQTDASGKGIAAVLSVCRDGEEMAIAFYSKKQSPAESRYSATEKHLTIPTSPFFIY